MERGCAERHPHTHIHTQRHICTRTREASTQLRPRLPTLFQRDYGLYRITRYTLMKCKVSAERADPTTRNSIISPLADNAASVSFFYKKKKINSSGILVNGIVNATSGFRISGFFDRKWGASLEHVTSGLNVTFIFIPAGSDVLRKTVTSGLNNRFILYSGWK